MGILLLVSGCASSAATEPLNGSQAASRSAVSTAETQSFENSVQSARHEALRVARAFADYRWSGGEENAFHGFDKWRNWIDTPDQKQLPDYGWQLDGKENVGIPYQWGGFSDLRQFENGIEEGLLAGHLPRKGQSGLTRKAVGVDCSGLVSRCWGLRSKQSTRSLLRISVQLSSYDDLLPGDILNLVNNHAMLFVRFEDSSRQTLHVIEATASKGKVHRSVHERSMLMSKGYLPLRYQSFVK